MPLDDIKNKVQDSVGHRAPGSLVRAASSSSAPKDVKALENVESSSLKPLSYPSGLNPSDLSMRHIIRFNVFKQDKAPESSVSPSGNYNLKAGSKKPSTYISDKGLTGAIVADSVLSISQSTIGAGGTALLSKITQFQLLDDANLDFNSRADKLVDQISMYMPDTIIVSDSHDYDSTSITEAAGLAGAMTAYLSGGIGTEEGKARLTQALGGNIIGDNFTEAYIQSKGYAVNPMLEVLYKGSQQRVFMYQFRFAPRNQKEAVEVINIIKTMRYHAAPTFSPGTSSRYFIPPSEFEIEFMMKTDDGLKYNTSIPRIGKCVLERVNVNYAASGNYATFKDGIPVEISLELAFKETIVLTKTDINNGY